MSESATKPQRRKPAGVRDTSTGRFVKGHSGNPGGKPKGLAAAARAEMTEEELTARMGKISRGHKIDGERPSIAERMKAMEWLAERGHGKAPAFAPIEGANPLELGDVERAIDSTLDELAARREAQASSASEARAVADASEG